MISVTFTDTIEHITSSNHLYQYDKGQQIEINGLTFTDTPVIHFANKMSDLALVIEPTISGDTLTAYIPDSLLREPHHITAYVYSYDANSGKTIKTVLIPIERRTKPDDYVFEGDEGFITLAEINARVNAMIAQQYAEFDTFISSKNSVFGEFLTDMNINVEHTIDTLTSTVNQNVSKWNTTVQQTANRVNALDGNVTTLGNNVSSMQTTVNGMRRDVGNALDLVEDAVKYDVLFEKVLNTSNTTAEDLVVVTASELSSIFQAESPILMFEFEGSITRTGIKSGSITSEGFQIVFDDMNTHNLFTVNVTNGITNTMTGLASVIAVMTGISTGSTSSAMTTKYYSYDISSDNEVLIYSSSYPYVIIGGNSYSTTQVNGTFRVKGVTR